MFVSVRGISLDLVYGGLNAALTCRWLSCDEKLDHWHPSAALC